VWQRHPHPARQALRCKHIVHCAAPIAGQREQRMVIRKNDAIALHFAAEVTALHGEQTLAAVTLREADVESRIEAAGLQCAGPIDHGFVKSVYFADPNGLPLEITTRVARHDEIMAEELAAHRNALAEWTAAKAAAPADAA